MSKLHARKKWIISSISPKGELIIDDGAINALKQGKSLLAAGIKKVNGKFSELIDERAGTNLDDYELRKIGSEIEGLIKYLLQNGSLSYNPDCRVMNFSMGLPKTNRVL